MKTILVPLDGSALAEQVLPSVQRLARTLDAQARLLRVVSDAESEHLVAERANETYPLAGSLTTQWQREQWAWTTLEQQAEQYLAETAAALREAGLTVDTEVQLGAPAEQIVALAERERVALIAMATHGLSGLRRWTLGSVADKVMHAAATPVLVVRSATPPQAGASALKRILVPLDGSELARRALPHAVELARGARAELILLHAVAPPQATFGWRPNGQSLPLWETDMSAVRARADQELTALAVGLSREVQGRAVVVSGMPAEMILDQAYAHQVDLIVMATHGYSGLRRWALGSVADKVLHAATTPLMLVRAGTNEAAVR
jgi:nucleotide-binding universal stress UspA family protein